MLCGSKVSRKVVRTRRYLVRVTWSNVVNARVWLVFVDNRLQMWLAKLSNSKYCFDYLVIHTI